MLVLIVEIDEIYSILYIQQNSWNDINYKLF